MSDWWFAAFILSSGIAYPVPPLVMSEHPSLAACQREFHAMPMTGKTWLQVCIQAPIGGHGFDPCLAGMKDPFCNKGEKP